MMTNLQKWFLIIAMWAVILFIVFAFYWTQIRPVKIRQICAKRASIVSEKMNTGLSNALEVHQAVYAECCRKNGLKE